MLPWEEMRPSEDKILLCKHYILWTSLFSYPLFPVCYIFSFWFCEDFWKETNCRTSQLGWDLWGLSRSTRSHPEIQQVWFIPCFANAWLFLSAWFPTKLHSHLFHPHLLEHLIQYFLLDISTNLVGERRKRAEDCEWWPIWTMCCKYRYSRRL